MSVYKRLTKLDLDWYRDRLSCDFKSSKQLFEELIQSNRFAFTKWIPLNIKAYKYSQLIQTEKKPYVYFMHVNMLIELRIPFLVSLSYEALISDRKMRSVLKLYCTSLYSYR